MSKKSRRRNRRLLKALGAGLAIAGLGGAFRKNTKGSTDADTVKLMTSDKAYKLPNVKENEFKEVIVTTPKTIKDSQVFVSKDPQVLGRMRGSGDEGGFTGQKTRGDYARKQRAIAADKRRNDMLRAIRSTQDIMTAQSNTPQNFKTSDFDYFKKGGRVGCGAAKKGFGKALKKGGRK